MQERGMMMAATFGEAITDSTLTRPGSGAAGSLQCLRDPLLNKGTAFSHDERARLGIDGLLPPRVESLQEQADRALENLRRKTNPLEKYRYLSALQIENETVFYRVVLDHLEEMLPIIYTPTVGEACIEWSRIYERPRGLYIAAQHRGRVAELLGNWPRSHAVLSVPAKLVLASVPP